MVTALLDKRSEIFQKWYNARAVSRANAGRTSMRGRPTKQRATPIPAVGDLLAMGLIGLLTRWFERKPEKRPPPEYTPPSQSQDDEDEEIAELIAIDII